MKAEITCPSKLSVSLGKHKTITYVPQQNDKVSLMPKVRYDIGHSPHIFMLCSVRTVFSDQRSTRPSCLGGSNVCTYKTRALGAALQRIAVSADCGSEQSRNLSCKKKGGLENWKVCDFGIAIKGKKKFHGHFQAFVFINQGSWCLKVNTEKRMTGS